MESYLEQHLPAIAKKMDWDGAAVYRRQEEEKNAALIFFTGEEPRKTCPFGVTPLGVCAESGKGTHREITNTRPEKYHSHLYLPIFQQSVLVGVLSVASVVGDFFRDPRRCADAQAFATHLGKNWTG